MNHDLLIQKTNSIQNCIKRITETLKAEGKFFAPLDIQDIISINLQRAVQISIDIAAHIISSNKLGTPQSLKETFQILEQNEWINEPLSSKMQKMVGFRNIAVHNYQSIEPKILESVIKHHLGDFEEFYTAILKKVDPTLS